MSAGNTPATGPLDVTLDAVHDLSALRSGERPGRGLWTKLKSLFRDPSSRERCGISFETDSNCDSSTDTLKLLRSRLRSAAALMTFGFSIYLVWHLAVMVAPEALGLPAKPANFDLLRTHVAVTIALTSVFGYLCVSSCVTKVKLSAAEGITFGAPAIWGLHWQYVGMTEMACDHHVLPPLSPVWLILIFTFALFIPVGWRRAGISLTTLALAPLALATVVMLGHPESRAAENADAMYFAEMFLQLLVSVVSAVVGVAAIQRLRRDAFEARQLGQYRLGELIGAGGMGEVYIAEHRMMKRPVAIKVIRPEKAGDPATLARFEREVRLTARLSHWNTIDIFDYGQADDGTLYYVMEYLPGLNLKELVTRGGPVGPGRTIHLLAQTCEALAEAHAAGLIHRDIKPANIFAAYRGGRHDVAKLLDFGLARPIVMPAGVDVTQAGSVTGSPQFMSPEQVLGEEPDERSDIYSLGAVAYWLLVGRSPFDHENPLRVLTSHVHERPASPQDVNPNVPADLDRVVMRCLEKRVEDRYQTAEELLAALRGCQAARTWDHDQAAAWWAESPSSEVDDVSAAALAV